MSMLRRMLWGDEELLFGVGSNNLTSADVIIPVDTIEQLSDEELIDVIRHLIVEAKLCHAEEQAAWIVMNADGREHFARVFCRHPSFREEIRNIFNIIHPFEDDSDQIRAAVDYIRYGEEKLYGREEMQRVKKDKRAYLASHYEKIFYSIGKRDGFRCKHCTSVDSLEIDHIIPLSKGGDNDLVNLQLLCRTCNLRKRDKVEAV